jgi:hypothetical protein
MQGAVDLRLAPQMPWDAVICTSRAVLASQEAQQDTVDEYLRTRFGNTPPRPVMPVIPLGITPKDYAHDPEARTRLRTRMSLGEKILLFLHFLASLLLENLIGFRSSSPWRTPDKNCPKD